MTFDTGVLIANWPAFAAGLTMTATVCCLSLPLGFVIGIVLAYARLRGHVLGRLAAGYVEAIRNLPFLIQVFLLFFVLPFAAIRLDSLTVGVIALTCYAAAHFCEIVRGAIAAVPAGQREAAAALGLSERLTFLRILLPQVLGYLLPAAGNLAITLVKESSVLSVIALPELTYRSHDILGRTFAPVEVFTLIAVVYWSLTAALAAATRWLERRVQPHSQPPQSKRASFLPGGPTQLENRS